MKLQITSEIEKALGRTLSTPKDFEYLRERIYVRLGEYVSSHTLKRIWGYLPSTVKPHRSTLDLLARFVGYPSYEEYLKNPQCKPGSQSSPVFGRKIMVRELCKGKKIRLRWHPERVCDIRYDGDYNFSVIYSENTRLKSGDTFSCSLIIEGEPLYIDNLRQGEKGPLAYVCGKQTGVVFEYLP